MKFYPSALIIGLVLGVGFLLYKKEEPAPKVFIEDTAEADALIEKIQACQQRAVTAYGVAPENYTLCAQLEMAKENARAELVNAPKDEVLEEVAACRKRAIEQTGVDTGYYKLCMDLVLDKRPANHKFYPASGE